MPFDLSNPTFTSNFKLSVAIYDWRGQEHTLQVFYVKTSRGTWDLHALADGSGILGGTPGVSTEIAGGALTYDNDGLLSTMTQRSNFYPIGALGPQPLLFNFGDDLAGGGTGLLGLTQFGGTEGVSAATFSGQDGNGFGALSSVQVNNLGELWGAFTNGTSRVLGRLVIATFALDQDLLPGSEQVFECTALSGPPHFSVPSRSATTVVAGALEVSDTP
jgi:flagellar hook protein FlgE